MANIVGEVKSAFCRVFLCFLLALSTACTSNPKQTTTKPNTSTKTYEKHATELNKPADKTDIATTTIDPNNAKTEPKPLPLKTTVVKQQPKQHAAAPTIKAKPTTTKPKLVVTDEARGSNKKQAPKIVVAKETKKKVEARKPLATKPNPKKASAITPQKAVNSAKPVPVIPKPQPPSFKLDDLPFEFGNWVIAESRNTQDQCVLRTKAQKLEDGAGGTPIYLEINGKQLSVRTKSDIDLSYPGSALVIGSSGYTFEGINKDTDAFIEAKLNQAINDLKLNEAADITLGFWPTWPRTTTHTTTIDISNAELALKGLAHCNSIIK